MTRAFIASLMVAACAGGTGPQGPEGPQGAKGDKGDPGVQGPAGDAGASGAAGTSVVASSEPGGANCTYGGAKFVTGPTTTYACNGAPGAGGITGITTNVAGGLTGGTTSGNATLALASCANNLVLKSNGAGWSCAVDNDTNYTAGSGLNLAGGAFSAAFTTAGGDNGTATTVARGDHVHDGRYPQKNFTTVTVHPTGTATQNGAALLAALASITDASATKPYLLKLEPGIYDLGSTAYLGKPYVDLEGSGRDVTTVQGATGLSLINMFAPSEIRELTVAHLGGVTAASALWFELTGGLPVVGRRITVSSTNGSSVTQGIQIGDGPGQALLEDVDVSVTGAGGPTQTFGIEVVDATGVLTARRVRVTASSPAGATCYGISTAGQTTIEDSAVNVACLAGGAYAIRGTSSLPFSVVRTTVVSSGHTANGVTTASQNVSVEAVWATATATGPVSGIDVAAAAPGGNTAIRRAVVSLTQTAGAGGTLGISLQNTNGIVEGSSVSVTSTVSTSSVDGIFVHNGTRVAVQGTVIDLSAPGGTLFGFVAGTDLGSIATYRFDQGRIVLSGGATAFSVQTGGAGTTMSIGASQLSGGTPSVISGVLRCANSYNQNDVPLNASCN